MMSDRWVALQTRRKVHEQRLAEVDQKMEAYAASILLEHLRKGKWTIQNRLLRPVDRAAQTTCARLLAEALKLGYHSAFTLYGEGVSFTGRIDDGELAIYVDPTYGATFEGIRKSGKALRIDVDLTPLLREHLQHALECAEGKFDQAKKNLEETRDALKMLDELLKKDGVG